MGRPDFLVHHEDTTLSIHVEEKLLALLGYDDQGHLYAQEVSPGLEEALTLWLRGGISEWVGDGSYRRLEIVTPEDPLFLWALASYIRRKIGFYTEMRIVVS